MIVALYNLGIWFYTVVAQILSVFGHRKAKLMLIGRKDTWQQLQAFQQQYKGDRVAWFHCASLGEFEQARPLLEAFKDTYPQYRILLTFFSPSGYEARKNYAKADLVCYLPADSTQYTQQFIALAQPNIAFFAKYEYWYHYLRTLSEQQIPIISFSAIFRPQQLFFKPWGGFSRKTISYCSHIFVQQKKSAELLKTIGLKDVSIAPDTRFDRVHQIGQSPQEIALAATFAQGQPTLIIGSAWQEDLEQLAPVLCHWQQPLKIIIAPHEISHTATMEKLFSSQLKTLRFSEATNATVLEADVLLIDNIGMLSSLYQYGTWAHIGGAFGKGLHNTLEAATFGLPIIFGPRYSKFQEAVDLVEQGGAFSVSNTEEFQLTFKKLYEDPSYSQLASEVAKKYVEGNLGGTQLIMDYVVGLINPSC